MLWPCIADLYSRIELSTFRMAFSLPFWAKREYISDSPSETSVSLATALSIETYNWAVRIIWSGHCEPQLCIFSSLKSSSSLAGYCAEIWTLSRTKYIARHVFLGRSICLARLPSQFSGCSRSGPRCCRLYRYQVHSRRSPTCGRPDLSEFSELQEWLLSRYSTCMQRKLPNSWLDWADPNGRCNI